MLHGGEEKEALKRCRGGSMLRETAARGSSKDAEAGGVSGELQKGQS